MFETRLTITNRTSQYAIALCPRTFDHLPQACRSPSYPTVWPFCFPGVWGWFVPRAPYKRAAVGPKAGGGTAAIHDEQAPLSSNVVLSYPWMPITSCTGFFTNRSSPNGAYTPYHHTVTVCLVSSPPGYPHAGDLLLTQCCIFIAGCLFRPCTLRSLAPASPI